MIEKMTCKWILISENVIENGKNVDEYESKDCQQNQEGETQQYAEHHHASEYLQGQSWDFLQDAENSQGKGYYWTIHKCVQVEWWSVEYGDDGQGILQKDQGLQWYQQDWEIQMTQ